jgi:UDP-N-acetylmuramate-alanine ligase
MKKVGVCGSHGKTTTTFFASQLIDKKINALIGDGSGFGNQESEYLLFEACEYQNNFLKYTYDYLVILNIDYDHPDYFKNANEYLYAFQKAALNTSFLVVNNDDNNCKKIVHKNKILFLIDLEYAQQPCSQRFHQVNIAENAHQFLVTRVTDAIEKVRHAHPVWQ